MGGSSATCRAAAMVGCSGETPALLPCSQSLSWEAAPAETGRPKVSVWWQQHRRVGEGGCLAR